MPRPVRKRLSEKENVKDKQQQKQKQKTGEFEQPAEAQEEAIGGLLTPIRTSTPRYGRRASSSSSSNRRQSSSLLAMTSSPSRKGGGGMMAAMMMGTVLSFDGLIDGVSPIKKGDAPHDELMTLTPPSVATAAGAGA
ncbi:hypothetical protein GGH99_007684, partial [Coemansia sp. RSA 1285]